MLAKAINPGEAVADVLLTVDDLAMFIESDSFGDLAGRVELEEGRLVVMPSEHQPHMRGVRLTVRTLSRAIDKHGLDDRFTVQPGGSIRLSDITVYDPDAMVIEGEGDDPKSMTPRNVVLLIEVADSSRQRDMGRKKRLYAQGGVREYWVLDVDADELHVFRDPVEGRYPDPERPLTLGDTVSPLFAPELTIAVEDLL